MMKADYSLPLKDGISPEGQSVQEGNNETFVGSTYTWSSVGPTADGDLGVDITAPGGAITSVSHWCLQKSMLMNGTSMSSPNAAGCVALLISACKEHGIPVSSARIKRALQNTAVTLPNLTPLQQGAGMIQVDAAFKYLQAFKDLGSEDIHFHVSLDNKAGNPRGIYLRQQSECSLRQSFSINVVSSSLVSQHHRLDAAANDSHATAFDLIRRIRSFVVRMLSAKNHSVARLSLK